MPVEVKPLFRPDVLRSRLKAFELSPRVTEHRELLVKWADLLRSAQADRLKEQELLPDFLTDIFTVLLGYSRPTDCPSHYLISREKHVQVDGKFADAVLGEFGEEQERFFVAVEGKGPTDPLDRPFKNRKMSAVDQAYRYAINLPCDWIIVTSMRQTRLYYKGADQLTYERFNIGEWAGEFRYRLFSQYIERLPVPNCSDADRDAIGALAQNCNSLAPTRHNIEQQFRKRLASTFGEAEDGTKRGSLNNKAKSWWELSLNQLGAALKTSFKLPANPFKNPRTADEWESYLAEKKAEVDRLSCQLADAEAELNDRVYRLFDLASDEIKLLQREVEH